MEFERRCWAEVDLGALRHNFRLIRRAAGEAAVMAVVKADAYGHGDVAVANLLDEEGAEWFAVSGFEEAVRLRRSGLAKPILILGYTSPENAPSLAVNDITQTVFSPEYAKALSDAAARAAVTVRVHLKVDTGMGRIGFSAVDGLDEAAAQMDEVYRLPGLRVTGIFTHFAAADSADEADKDYTRRQYALLDEAVSRLAAAGRDTGLVHCCNSAGTVAWPEFHRDLVRPGIILYGHDPSADVHLAGLRPAMRLLAVVSMVKEVKAGDCISYGRTFTAERPLRLATLTIGYADGYPRVLSGRGVVSIHGRPARVVGRVCMDQMMVDVTDIPGVQAGDEAVIFGDETAHSVEDIAQAEGTVNYEVLCDIGRRVQRLYVENGAQAGSVNYLQEQGEL